jgi:hypothetical protein
MMKRLTGSYRGDRIIATVSTERGYFSVTGELWHADEREPYACGQIRDEIREAFPQLRPLLALHLSDAHTGEPMHAEANGYYWLAGAAGGLGQEYHGANGSSPRTAAQCVTILAEHLRISHDEATALVRNAGTRAAFAEVIAGMRPRWAAEAVMGRELLKGLS